MAMVINGTPVAVSMAAIAAAGGGIIEVPTGTWTGFFELACGNVWFRGDQNGASIMQFLSGGGAENYIVRAVNPATWRRKVRFSDITFDAVGASFGCNFAGYAFDDITFERCRFINFTGGIGAVFNECRRLKFIDCTYLSPGNSLGVGISLGSGCYDVDVVRCDFSFGANAIVIDSGIGGEIPFGRFLMQGGKCRGDYWLQAVFNSPEASGAGAGVTYGGAGDNTLTDVARDFTLIPLDTLRTIRLMPVATTGNTTNVGMTSLRDNLKDFRLMGLSYGDLVRTATAWAMVVGTNPLDGGELYIDGWYDRTTYDDAASPAIGTAYTVYQIILGETNSYPSPTQVQSIGGWRKLDGTIVTVIPDGTRYEILGARASNSVLVEAGATQCTFDSILFHGCWSDNLAPNGDNTVVQNCRFMYGQDAGMTLRGRGSRAINCVFNRNGSSNLIIDQAEGVDISHSTFLNGSTEYTIADIGSDIGLYAATECTIFSNRMENVDNPRALYGITFRGDAITGYSTKNRVYDNRIIGHTNAPFLIEPNNWPNRIWDNEKSS